MMRSAVYDDGLDDDGFPVSDGGRKRFIHGDESLAGDFKPIRLVDASAIAVERIRHFVNLSADTDSPIETHVGAAVLMFFQRAGLPLKLCKMIDLRDAPDALLMIPQFAWSYYRSDWAILNPKRAGALLIECDGKDFHTAPAQREHDAKKDAAALEYGYLTLRFTGSQIHRDADGCAQKVFDAVCGL